MQSQAVRIVAVGTANPPQRYTQDQVLDHYGIHDPRIRSLFAASHIEHRHLYLPADGAPEPQGRLLEKHLVGALELGALALDRSLAEAGLVRADVDYLCCVTTTGYLTPGLTARFIDRLGLREDTGRADIVGMGCNAALNGLNPVSAWAAANPGGNAVMVCVEVCSAAYVMRQDLKTAVVNSLFGDGAAAALVRSTPGDARHKVPSVLGFSSHLIPSAIEAMRYVWDAEEARFSFELDRDIPYVVGAHAEKPVGRLLERFGLRRRDIAHWLVHSGGKKVVDAIMYNLGLTAHDVRHTTSVLRDFGNLSSASVLFSYERLLAERGVRPGDRAVMMTMGPGSTIETALLQW